jgi:hypothetical protein
MPPQPLSGKNKKQLETALRSTGASGEFIGQNNAGFLIGTADFTLIQVEIPRIFGYAGETKLLK